MKIRIILSCVAKYFPTVARFYRATRDWVFEARPSGVTFSVIYKKRIWEDRESVSGPGSNLMQTSALRAELPSLLERIGAKSLLDAPCGDFNWMKETKLKIDKYIGVDVVLDLVRYNQATYANHQREFRQLDITKDRLPMVDVILCRDCLVHFSYKRICLALESMKSSGSIYLLTTTFEKVVENTDIVTGGWRPLNLRLHPFNFPPPIYVIDENSADPDVQRHKKVLGLWKFTTLSNF